MALAAASIAFVQPAAAQGQLSLYCSVQEEWCRPMATEFERQTGIKVNMTRKSSGETFAQIKAEPQNPRGDGGWGRDPSKPSRHGRGAFTTESRGGQGQWFGGRLGR